MPFLGLSWVLGAVYVLVTLPVLGAVYVLVPLPVLGFVWLGVDTVLMWTRNMVLVVVTVMCMVPAVGDIVVAPSSAPFFEHNVVQRRPGHGREHILVPKGGNDRRRPVSPGPHHRQVAGPLFE